MLPPPSHTTKCSNTTSLVRSQLTHKSQLLSDVKMRSQQTSSLDMKPTDAWCTQ